MCVFRYVSPLIVACLDTRLLLLQTTKSVLIQCLVSVSHGLGLALFVGFWGFVFFNEESTCWTVGWGVCETVWGRRFLFCSQLLCICIETALLISKDLTYALVRAWEFTASHLHVGRSYWSTQSLACILIHFYEYQQWVDLTDIVIMGFLKKSDFCSWCIQFFVCSHEKTIFFFCFYFPNIQGSLNPFRNSLWIVILCVEKLQYIP